MSELSDTETKKLRELVGLLFAYVFLSLDNSDGGAAGVKVTSNILQVLPIDGDGDHVHQRGSHVSVEEEGE